MKIAVSGSSGLVGTALVPFLRKEGNQVIRLVRRESENIQDEITWQPDKGKIDKNVFEGLDAVINLAGENISGGRWTPEKKAKIYESRVRGTRFLCETLSKLKKKPAVLISASAAGYYGNRGEEILNEESVSGSGFLSDVSRDWEGATKEASDAGIRVVALRIGMVLSPKGGALEKMLLPFKMGLGGKIGEGNQYMSWIDIDDLIRIIDFALTNEKIEGPVNAVSPHPVTNIEFTETLGKVLGRPTLLFVPAFAAKLVLGEMAEELLMASARVEPAKLLKSGYEFKYPELEGALKHLLVPH